MLAKMGFSVIVNYNTTAPRPGDAAGNARTERKGKVMSGIAEDNTKRALVGGIYFSVAMIVAIGFTIRGSEVQARSEAAMVPASQLMKPVAASVGFDKGFEKADAKGNAKGDKRSNDKGELRDEKDSQIGDHLGNDIGGNFGAGSLMEPGLELIAKRAVRRIVF